MNARRAKAAAAVLLALLASGCSPAEPPVAHEPAAKPVAASPGSAAPASPLNRFALDSVLTVNPEENTFDDPPPRQVGPREKK